MAGIDFKDTIRFLIADKRKEFENLEARRNAYYEGMLGAGVDLEMAKVWLEVWDKEYGFKEIKRGYTTMQMLSANKPMPEKIDLEPIKAIPIESIYNFEKIKRNRHGFVAICPLHEDTKPSFSVKNNRFNCFACGKKGSVIDFIMFLYGVTFIQAVERLRFET